MTRHYRVLLELRGVGLAYVGERAYVVAASDEQEAGAAAIERARRSLLVGRVLRIEECDDLE